MSNPKLTDLQIRNAKAPCKLHDGEGLWIEVSSAGKAWRTKFTQGGATKQITLGYYPEMRLADAKAARIDVRRKVQAGLRPLVARPRVERSTGTVEAKARTWHAYHAQNTWSGPYGTQVLQRLENHAFAAIGALALEQVTRRQVIDLVEACVTSAGKHQADHVRKHLVMFFDDLMLREEIAHNPAAGLARKFQPPKRRPQPAVLKVEEAREVLAKVEASTANPMLLLLHRFAALTGVRPSEARETEWREVADDVWEIPAERMKGRRGRQEPHTVFLPPQAVQVLEVAKLYGRGGRFVFPSNYRASRDDKPYDRSSLVRRMNEAVGKRVHVAHGWRATMATIMTARHRADRDLIQAMLAHQTKGTVAGRYDRSTLHMHEARVRELAAEWASLLLERAPSPYALAGLHRPVGNVVRLADRRAA